MQNGQAGDCLQARTEWALRGRGRYKGMKCRYAGEPLRIRALSIKEVLEPGELVLYEARFHKTSF